MLVHVYAKKKTQLFRTVIVKMLIQPFRSGSSIMRSLVAPDDCCQSSLDWCRIRWAGLRERYLTSHTVLTRAHTDTHTYLCVSVSCTACS